MGNVVAKPRSGEPASDRAPEFPTLAELLSAGDAAPASPLTVLIECGDDAGAVDEALPAGSIVVDISGGLAAPAAPATAEGARPRIESLDGLIDLVRHSARDVLVVSAPRLVTDAALDGLRSALADDSACASASLVEATVPHVPGVPSPGAVAPRRGVVLVRRDHLLLALEETGQVGHTDIGLIALPDAAEQAVWVLASIDRPGFVHRVVGTEQIVAGSASPPPPKAPLARRRAARIVVDGRCFAHPRSGTQVQVVGLVRGLLRAGADVAVLRPGTIHPSVEVELARLPEAPKLVERSGVRRPDVFHRPFQVLSLHELADGLSLGERLVLTHQDMILDRTRAYAHADGAWEDYRATTTAALSSADEVGFFSRHAALDAASDGAVALDRATVVPLGVDHLERRPADDAPHEHPVAGRPFLLVVGNSYWHKNRLFALRLLHWLVEAHGWDGGLVLAGGHPGRGSSRAAEEAFIAETPVLRGRVADLSRVPDSLQSRLYGTAELVLFPSLYEGFGLIPFEAAAAGTACVYTHRSSMREFLPTVGALPSFDLAEAGAFVYRLLEDPGARARVVAAIADGARTLTWDRTAAGYLDVYERALAREPRGVSRALVSVSPKSARVTAQESVVLDVYRRRRGFRLAVDGVIRGGSIAVRTGRLLRGRKGRNG